MLFYANGPSFAWAFSTTAAARDERICNGELRAKLNALVKKNKRL